MQTDKRSGRATSLFVLTIALQGSCCWHEHDNQAHLAECRKNHGFPDHPNARFYSNCPATGCGLNGVWLGAGVNFRTLHTTPGIANEAGLSVLDFRDAAGRPLTLHVDGDDLYGTLPGGMPLRKFQLEGSVLTLGPPAGKMGITYELTIAQYVDDLEYWASGPGCSVPDCSDHPRGYAFIARSVDDDCQVELCQPGIDENRPGSLAGEAVVFAGDYYDEATHGVSTMPIGGADDTLNLACLGTAISKLHMMRHTSASGSVTTAAQRQSLLRLLTADYCGDGMPFTQDGTPIRMSFNAGPGATPLYSVTTASGYSPAAGDMLEAAWTPGGGASCIGHARLGMTRSDINARCQLQRAAIGLPPPPSIPECTTTPPGNPADPFVGTNYIVSSTPLAP